MLLVNKWDLCYSSVIKLYTEFGRDIFRRWRPRAFIDEPLAFPQQVTCQKCWTFHKQDGSVSFMYL